MGDGPGWDNLPVYCQAPVTQPLEYDSYIYYDISSTYSGGLSSGEGNACIWISFDGTESAACDSPTGWSGDDLNDLAITIGDQAPMDGWKSSSTMGKWTAGFTGGTTALSENQIAPTVWETALRQIQALSHSDGAGVATYYLSQSANGDSSINWVVVYRNTGIFDECEIL
jgi:hypothetical protein